MKARGNAGALATLLLIAVAIVVAYLVIPPFPFWGAVRLGLVYAFVGLGVYLSFRVLDFPDLTVDGSFPLGAAVVATMLVAGVNPWLATLAAMLAGGAAGLVTAFLNVRFRILHLLASILTMTALFSINLRIMGAPNVSLLRQETIFTPFSGVRIDNVDVTPLIVLSVLVLAALGVLIWFLNTDFGLGIRATGANPRMARSQGVKTNANIYAGMALSNGLVGLAGALFAQTTTYADATSGRGTIVIGLAAVIVGETLFRFRGMWAALVGCVIGAVLYYLARQTALDLGQPGELLDWLEPSDLSLITAVIVALALILPRLRIGWRR